jgi:hypothetical protein
LARARSAAHLRTSPHASSTRRISSSSTSGDILPTYTVVLTGGGAPGGGGPLGHGMPGMPGMPGIGRCIIIPGGGGIGIPCGGPG